MDSNPLVVAYTYKDYPVISDVRCVQWEKTVPLNKVVDGSSSDVLCLQLNKAVPLNKTVDGSSSNTINSNDEARKKSRRTTKSKDMASLCEKRKCYLRQLEFYSKQENHLKKIHDMIVKGIEVMENSRCGGHKASEGRNGG